jgi:hypothetical protein
MPENIEKRPDDLMLIIISESNYIDTEDQIPPFLPLQKGGIPLFEKEGVGGDFGRLCLVNYGSINN